MNISRFKVFVVCKDFFIFILSGITREENISGAILLPDEPSVGLYAADVHKLIEVLQRLVDAGNSVLIIEHNPDIVKVADWLINLGPAGGDRGGELIAEGTPEQVIKVKKSYTGQFLKVQMK